MTEERKYMECIWAACHFICCIHKYWRQCQFKYFNNRILSSIEIKLNSWNLGQGCRAASMRGAWFQVLETLHPWTRTVIDMTLSKARYNYPCTSTHHNYGQFDAMHQSIKINLSSRADGDNPEKSTDVKKETYHPQCL